MKAEYVDTRAYFKWELSEARKALKKAERNYRRAVAETETQVTQDISAAELTRRISDKSIARRKRLRK
jgi:hypothetical protein